MNEMSQEKRENIERKINILEAIAAEARTESRIDLYFLKIFLRIKGFEDLIEKIKIMISEGYNDPKSKNEIARSFSKLSDSTTMKAARFLLTPPGEEKLRKKIENGVVVSELNEMEGYQIAYIFGQICSDISEIFKNN